MPIEHQMASHELDSTGEISTALRGGWEPFAIYDGRMYFRRQHFSEEREPLSSTKHANEAGNEPDRG